MSTSAAVSECGGRDAAPAAHERHERDQPEQVLRREDLVERDEGADARRGVADEPLARGGPAGEREPECDEHCRLRQREHRAERAVAGDVLRTVRRRRSAGGRTSSASEAPSDLDLQRPRRLAREAVDQSPCGATTRNGTTHEPRAPPPRKPAEPQPSVPRRPRRAPAARARAARASPRPPRRGAPSRAGAGRAASATSAAVASRAGQRSKRERIERADRTGAERDVQRGPRAGSTATTPDEQRPRRPPSTTRNVAA